MQKDQLKWAVDVLAKLNYRTQSDVPIIIEDNPWACVSQFETDQGFDFLKMTPPALFLESKVIKKIAESFMGRCQL